MVQVRPRGCLGREHATSWGQGRGRHPAGVEAWYACPRSRQPPAGGHVVWPPVDCRHAAGAAAAGGLVRSRAYVAGEWIDADTAARRCPSRSRDGEEHRHACRAWAPPRRAGRSRRARRAAGVAAAAREGARRILRRWADLMLEHREELALLMTAEQGKPLAESRAEIDYAASFYEWFGEEAKRVYGETIPQPCRTAASSWSRSPSASRRHHAVELPGGDGHAQAAPALAAGCTMVLKPAEQTPLSALAVMALASRRPAAGRALDRHRRRRGRARDRRRDDLQPARAQARLHRLHGGRQAAHAPVRRPGEEGLAGARRQRAVHRLRRRRPRRGGRRRAGLQVPQQRPDLHLRQPHPGAGRRLRRVHATADGGRDGARRRRGTDPRRRSARSSTAGAGEGRAPRGRRARPRRAVVLGGERHELGGTSSSRRC